MARRIAGRDRLVTAAARPAAISPLHSLEGLASAFFVASIAAGWIAVATTTTAPLLAARELLGRAAKVFEKL
ncbi:MAG TPA: hypothetical protein VGK20_01300 [Candidatus Binatia bacterium]